MSTLPAFDLVIFGGTGDLALRKLLPAMYQQSRAGSLPADARILAAARQRLDREGYLAQVRPKVQAFLGPAWDEAAWETFAAHLHYRAVDASDPASFEGLEAFLNAHPDRVRVYYLSTAPAFFAAITATLHDRGLVSPASRVVLEKPLGHDLASSRAINDAVGRHFTESQIFRIDHYLGKEPVQNLLALRFGNILFEPLWRREWVRDVQITVAEQLGVEGRGDFYEATGALRDMVQNHLLQLLCIVAMEPPSSGAPDALRDEKLKVLRSLRPFSPQDVAARTVRGQYRAGAAEGRPVPAYADEPGVSKESRTETFVALKAEIDTWRWAGVPFYLRTGKRMQERTAEIVISFREVPHTIFPAGSRTLSPNRLVIQMQPEETLKLHLAAKQPGDAMALTPVTLDLDFAESFRIRRLEAYERLLLDAIRGNLTLFVRRDEQEAAWEWVEPILKAWEGEDRPKPYTSGTWGPAASSALLSRDGLAWHEEG